MEDSVTHGDNDTVVSLPVVDMHSQKSCPSMDRAMPRRGRSPERRKKHKHKKRKRVSPSPANKTRARHHGSRVNKSKNHEMSPSDRSDSSDVGTGDSRHAVTGKQFFYGFPSWMNQSYPPGPWQPMPAGPMTMPMPPHWNMDTEEHSDEWEVPDNPDLEDDYPLTVNDAAAPQASTSHVDQQGEVSLAKHVDSAYITEDVGPKVSDQLATLIQKLWDKSHKEEIKDLFANNARPENTPSLQKVDLDEDIASGPSDKARPKRMEYLAQKPAQRAHKNSYLTDKAY